MAAGGADPVGFGGAVQHGRSRHDDLRRGRPIAEGAVWPYGVVVLAPLFDQHLGFLERVEHLAVQQLVAELAVEGFDVAVLPRAEVVPIGRTV
jgi:hypothetical protein